MMPEGKTETHTAFNKDDDLWSLGLSGDYLVYCNVSYHYLALDLRNCDIRAYCNVGMTLLSKKCYFRIRLYNDHIKTFWSRNSFQR